MYKIFPKFVLRTPLLSFDNVEKILHNEESVLLKLKDKQIQEAIFLASPRIYEKILSLLNNEIDELDEKNKLMCTIVKYLCRMSTRCTPFGLFAGCSVGTIGTETKLELSNEIDYKIRLDMLFLCSLAQTLMQIPSVRKSIKYHINSSIYTLGNKYRYIEYKYHNSHRKHQISSVEKTEYLDVILSKAQSNITIKELADCIVTDDIEYEEAEKYIEELIANQLLIGEIEPHDCGCDYFTKIVKILSSLKSDHDENIPRVLELNKKLMQFGKEDNFQSYQEIIELISHIDVPFDESVLFQVDMNRIVNNATVDESIIRDIHSTISFLNKISPPTTIPTLDQFRESFYNRFENQEVPLLLALDPEIGIGYPVNSQPNDTSPLIDNFKINSRGNSLSSFSKTKLQSVLLQKMLEMKTTKELCISLTDEDFKDFKENWNDLPSTFFTVVNIVKVESQDYLLHFEVVAGSSGANLLSRFAHCNTEINDFVHEITLKEDELADNIAIAEISHLPAARTGNVLARPHIRRYELILSNTDLPNESQIPLSDLMLSIRNGRLYLRSQKLNKQVIPRLTVAHNFQKDSIPVYHFLCDLQYYFSGRNQLLFDWGFLGNELSFRPRVKYRDSILSLASWTIHKEELTPFLLKTDETEFLSEVNDWRKNKSMPRYVQLVENDNKLFVDWENKMSLLALFSTIKKSQSVIFEEFIFSSQNSFVSSDEGGHTNEFIFAFYNNNNK